MPVDLSISSKMASSAMDTVRAAMATTDPLKEDAMNLAIRINIAAEKIGQAARNLERYVYQVPTPSFPTSLPTLPSTSVMPFPQGPLPGKLSANIAGSGAWGGIGGNVLGAGPTNNGASMFLDVGVGRGGSSRRLSSRLSSSSRPNTIEAGNTIHAGSDNTIHVGTVGVSRRKLGISTNSRKHFTSLSSAVGESDSGTDTNSKTTKSIVFTGSRNWNNRADDNSSGLPNLSNVPKKMNGSRSIHKSSPKVSFLQNRNPILNCTPHTNPIRSHPTSFLQNPLLQQSESSPVPLLSSNSAGALPIKSAPPYLNLPSRSKFDSTRSNLLAKPIPALRFAQQYQHGKAHGKNGMEHNPHSSFLVIAPSGGVDIPKVVYESIQLKFPDPLPKESMSKLHTEAIDMLPREPNLGLPQVKANGGDEGNE